MLKNLKLFIINFFIVCVLISCNAQSNNHGLSYLKYSTIHERTNELDLRAIIKDLRRDDNIAPASEGGYVLRTAIKNCVFGGLPFTFYESFYFDKDLNVSDIKVLFTSSKSIKDQEKMNLLINDFKELFLLPDTNLDCKLVSGNHHLCVISQEEQLVVEYGEKSFINFKYLVVYKE